MTEPSHQCRSRARDRCRNATAAPAPAAKAAPGRARTAQSSRCSSSWRGFYPQLFGAVFLPLKRGIFQDLLAAHPDVFERDALKEALGFHTRSTRYLVAVAAGRQRHDLQGQPVEAMAPEHVHQALLEVFRRRQARAREDLRPKLRERIVQAFEASGLAREAYAQLVRGRDEAANALLDEALARRGERSAKDEALLRAFDASGRSVEAFADMYGLEPRAAARSLERARRLRATRPRRLKSRCATDGSGQAEPGQVGVDRLPAGRLQRERSPGRAASSGSGRPPARAGRAPRPGRHRQAPPARRARCAAGPASSAAAPGCRTARWRSRTLPMASTYSTFWVAISNTRRICGSVAVRRSAASRAARSCGSGSAGALARACVQRVLHRQGDALHHGVEQIGLVLEVPVDGAARRAGRRAMSCSEVPDTPCCWNSRSAASRSAAAGGEGVFLGAACHALAGSRYIHLTACILRRFSRELRARAGAARRALPPSSRNPMPHLHVAPALRFFVPRGRPRLCRPALALLLAACGGKEQARRWPGAGRRHAAAAEGRAWSRWRRGGRRW